MLSTSVLIKYKYATNKTPRIMKTTSQLHAAVVFTVLLLLRQPWQQTIVHAFSIIQVHPPSHPASSQSPLFLAKQTPSDNNGGSSTADDDGKKRLVICGGGIGGLSTAFDARHLLRPHDVEIVVVSDREHFQFTPSNPWVALRRRTADEISLPLAEVLPRHQIKFVHGRAQSLNVQQQELVLSSSSSSTGSSTNKKTKIPYDYLVISTGPRLGFDEIPGAAAGRELEHDRIHTASICTTPHAAAAAEQWDRLAADPGPIVVGAAQGASCFGPAYEYALMLRHELQRRGGRRLVEQCPIHFVTSEPYIGHLGLQGAGNSRQILTKMLEDRQINYTTNCKVQRVNPDSVAIQYFDDNDTVHHEVLPSRLTMLIPPFRGIDAWKTVPGLTDDHGMILVNNHQQSVRYPNIFGVGVCVHIDPLEQTKVPTGVPKTGYMIESMGTAAVKNIRDMILADAAKAGKAVEQKQKQQQQLHHVPLLNGLCITDFGDSGAVFVAMPQIPPRRHDYTITGKIGTLAKIAFERYFLHKIESGDTDPYYEKYALGLIGIQRTTVD